MVSESSNGARRKVESWASSEGVRRNMQANGRRDTKPEVAVRRLLHASGLRFRVQYPVEGNRRRSIDIAFTRQRVACFIDGCFWHGCPIHFVAPKSNAAFWRTKIGGNMERDAETTALLEHYGWQVVRFWEHEQPLEVARAIGLRIHESSEE